MSELLARLCIKNHTDVKNPKVRTAYGTMASVVGIVVNLLLSALKLFAGILCGSVSITADAVNNLSDAGSQTVSLVSFRIAAKPADRDHPFGHARMEYVASMAVSFLILLVGFELFKESVAKILHPTPTVFSLPVFLILGASVLAKLWLFFFNRRVARRIASPVLKATATDSLSDAASTGAVLISALVGHFTPWQTDAYMGILVAFLILYAGVKILIDTKNSILGGPPEKELVDEVERLARSYPEVLGIHDLLMHNYGAHNTVASLHAEVDGAANVFETHDAIDNLERRLFEELGVRATVHMDPIVTNDERVNELREKTRLAVKGVSERFGIHDFRCVEGRTHTNLIFDVVVPFEEKRSEEEIRKAITEAVQAEDTRYFAVITIDRE